MTKIAEQWKDVNGYEGLYEISSLGQIRNIRRQTIKKPTKITNEQGCTRMSVNLSKRGVQKSFIVSTLMVRHFFKQKKGMVQFKDDDPTNCKADNILVVKATEKFRSAHFRMVRDTFTGVTYESVSALAKELGVLPESVTIGIRDKYAKYLRYTYV